MNKLSIVLALGILLILVTGSAGHAGSPPLPASFYGTVKLDGVNVAAGTVVSAWINGVKYAEALTFFDGGDSVYDMDVPGDDPDTPEVEGGQEGNTIVFQVAGYDADQTAPWHSGTDQRLDLTATAGPDLVVTDLDLNAVVTDPQTLIMGGTGKATIRNQGNADVPADATFAVTFFEDRDGDGAYDPRVDNTLGQATYGGGLAVGEEAEVRALVTGEVLFRDNRVHAFVDSGQVIDERDETNNVYNSGSRCASRPPGPFTWEPETLIGGGLTVSGLDLVVDASDHPHISYKRENPGSHPGISMTGHAYYDGSLWHHEDVQLDAQRYSQGGTSIALGSDGQPRMLYAHCRACGLTYATRTGPDSWSYETYTHGTNWQWYFSLALDSTDNAHISYLETSAGNLPPSYPFYATNAGGAWSTTRLDDGRQLTYGPFDIVLDGSDRPHVLHFSRDPVTLLYHLTHGYYDGTDWHWESVDSCAGQCWGPASLAFDSRGMAHVAYFIGQEGSNRVKYASRLPTGWTSEVVDPDVWHAGDWVHPSLAFDPDDRPHIVYADVGGMMHAYRDAAGWHSQVIQSDQGPMRGRWPVVASDSAGRLHVAGSDLDGLYYARSVLPVPTAAPDLTASRLLMDVGALPAAIELTARVGNGGATQAVAGVPVAFYDGDPLLGGTLITTTLTSQPLAPGQYEDVTITWNSPPPGAHDIYVVADDDGTRIGMHSECDETNNAHHQPVDTNVIGPDLVVPAMDHSGMSTDPQALTIAGDVSVQLRNQGNQDVTEPFEITLFEDTDGDGAFTPPPSRGEPEGGDNVLGQRAYFGTLAAGQSVWLPMAVAGNVLFRDNLIYAFADSQDAIAELDEDNNLNNTGAPCQYLPPEAQFQPELEWEWTGSTTLASSNQVMMMPAVVDLTADGVPDVVFASYTGRPQSGYPNGHLRAIHGEDGSEIFTVTDTNHDIYGASSIAVGDIDLDGRPEILAVDKSSLRIIAFEHDSTFKWRSPQIPSGYRGIYCGGAAIADLDQDGTPEIVVGATVLNNDGTERWTGSGGRGDNAAFGPLSLVANLDTVA